jgi:hypothetical protein
MMQIRYARQRQMVMMYVQLLLSTFLLKWGMPLAMGCPECIEDELCMVWYSGEV